MIANNIEIERVNYIPAKEPYRSRSASSLYSEIYEETEKREAAKKPFEDYREVVDKLRNFLKPNKEPININIRHHEFILPYNLGQISDAILESEYLLDLEEDWDDEGADSTNFETYKNAIDFVISSSKFLNTYSSKVEKPFIDITRDGSISVQWDTPKATFFIIFKKNNKEYAYYYGQEKETNIGFKYRLKLSDKTDLITLSWMLQYLT